MGSRPVRLNLSSAPYRQEATNRTEAAPMRWPAKERPSSYKYTGHIRQAWAKLQDAAAAAELACHLYVRRHHPRTGEIRIPLPPHFPAANLRKIRLRRRTIALVLAQRLEEKNRGSVAQLHKQDKLALCRCRATRGSRSFVKTQANRLAAPVLLPELRGYYRRA